MGTVNSVYYAPNLINYLVKHQSLKGRIAKYKSLLESPGFKRDCLIWNTEEWNGKDFIGCYNKKLTKFCEEQNLKGICLKIIRLADHDMYIIDINNDGSTAISKELQYITKQEQVEAKQVFTDKMIQDAAVGNLPGIDKKQAKKLLKKQEKGHKQKKKWWSLKW